MGSYATVAQLKTNVGKTGTEDDTNLGVVLDAAEKAIDAFCNRPDGFKAISTATARLFNGSGRTYQYINECAAVTIVAVKDSPSDSTYVAWAATDWLPFQGDPHHPEFNRTPYNGIIIDASGSKSFFLSGRYGSGLRGFKSDPDTDSTRQVPTVKVTAKWGYSVAVPAQITMAAIAQAARWWKRGKGAWQDALQSSEFGTMMYVKALDPDVQFMLVNGRLVKPAIGGRA